MKNILLVTTQYRVGERIYPIIPELAKYYNLDLMKLYQMDPDWKWPGDVDLRDNFEEKYHIYFEHIHVRFPNDLDYSKYDLIITDDNRPYNGLPQLYSKRQCPVIACSHGVTEHNYHISGKDKSFDYCFVFGQKEVTADYHLPAGIPANDKLKELLYCEKKHILVIVNYLGNAGKVSTGNGTFFKLFDENVFNNIDLLSMQQKYNLPVVIKLKSRPDVNMIREQRYLLSILPDDLDYKVLYDVVDDNKLIAESIEVISAPSTLALKPIQLGIPTTLIEGTGQSGVIFNDYGSNKNFIEDTLEGGNSFNSTGCVVNYVEQLLNG